MKNNIKKLEGTCKVLGRSVVFSAFYADFLSLPHNSDYHHLNKLFDKQNITLVVISYEIYETR